jgi:hypothetical protein
VNRRRLDDNITTDVSEIESGLDSSGLGLAPVAGVFEHGGKTSVSIKLFNKLGDCQFHDVSPLHGISM